MTIVSITAIIIAGCWLAKVASSRERHCHYWLRDGTDAMNKPGDWRLATEKNGSLISLALFWKILEQQLEFDRPFMGRGATDRL